MYEIFLKLLNEKGVTAYKVGKATGIAGSTFTDWKNGRSVPKQEKLQKIADYFGVSLEYLTTGKDSQTDSLYSDENADLLIKITKSVKNDPAFADRMARYMSLISENKKSVDDMIDLMYSKEHDGEV
jgi:transcriptional regulator with XRE-family HTH domain